MKKRTETGEVKHNLYVRLAHTESTLITMKQEKV